MVRGFPVDGPDINWRTGAVTSMITMDSTDEIFAAVALHPGGVAGVVSGLNNIFGEGLFEIHKQACWTFPDIALEQAGRSNSMNYFEKSQKHYMLWFCKSIGTQDVVVSGYLHGLFWAKKSPDLMDRGLFSSSGLEYLSCDARKIYGTGRILPQYSLCATPPNPHLSQLGTEPNCRPLWLPVCLYLKRRSNCITHLSRTIEQGSRTPSGEESYRANNWHTLRPSFRPYAK